MRFVGGSLKRKRETQPSLARVIITGPESFCRHLTVRSRPNLKRGSAWPIGVKIGRKWNMSGESVALGKERAEMAATRLASTVVLYST
ncbi:hypothetical protein O181_026502 [Austropuccinia psidii MF-1]|uniref:Uncharacterized protein n=1 Tax=Austropuccinia psidii MF-1 TaxID=1389203 RepID=A0A9Q3CN66_9BASI|nr:hypothetical protein [Austropuccinia psidii MF-1]